MTYALIFTSIIAWQAGYCNQADTPSQEERLLKTAFAARSDSLLREFFLRWEQDSQPASAEDIAGQPPMIRHAYELFEKIYRPFSSPPYYPADSNDIQSTFPYVVIPSSMTIRICDSVHFRIRPANWREHILVDSTISNFRPNLRFGIHRALFLTEKCKAIIESFMSEGSAKVRKKKIRFIGKYIKIGEAYGSGVCTFPIIRSIYFDESFSKAEINFQTAPNGGTVVLAVRTEQGWSNDVTTVSIYKH
jgi:hypothetical protein